MALRRRLRLSGALAALGLLGAGVGQTDLQPRIDALGLTTSPLDGGMPLALTGANFYEAESFGPDARSFPHNVRSSNWPKWEAVGLRDGWVGRASDGPFCRFGGPAAPPVLATWVSPTEVRCDAVPPSDGPRTVRVELSLDGPEGRYIESAQRFTYYDDEAAPTIARIEPASGPVAGGTSLRLHGSNFRVGADGRCTFAMAGQPTVSAAAQFVSADEVTCVTPAASGPGAVLVAYDAGSQAGVATHAISAGVGFFYSTTSAGASTMTTGADRVCAGVASPSESTCQQSACEFVAAQGDDAARCAAAEFAVLAGTTATFTISARTAAGHRQIPEGDAFYVRAVSHLEHDHNSVAGTVRSLIVDEAVQCDRSGGSWGWASFACSETDLEGAAVGEQAACEDLGGVWAGVGEPDCSLAAPLTAESCGDYGDTWLPPVCLAQDGNAVGAASERECLFTGNTWNASVTAQCTRSSGVPWWDTWEQEPPDSAAVRPSGFFHSMSS